MNPSRFRIESSPISFGLIGECKAYCERIGLFLVYEQYIPPEKGAGRAGEYRVIIDTEIADQSELEKRNVDAVAIAQELEMLWPYVWTIPLHGQARGLTFRLIEPPDGWTTNKDEISRQLAVSNGETLLGDIRFTKTQSMFSNAFPLERALRIRAQYQQAEPIMRSLIDFHYEALQSKSEHSSLFLLAKGLEITRAYLPGKTDKEKQISLPKEVQEELKTSYHSLFDLANSRKNTRHAIKSKLAGIELHPELIGTELEDFIHDCDLVIRAVVCDYFNEDVVITLKSANPF